ncbi:MAG: endonuclease domain-containing protein [Phycisphaerales bacterium]
MPWIDRREQARRLRRTMNFHEALLWTRLRQVRRSGLHFRRQHPVGSWFLDFACVSRRLGIELDGSTHDDLIRDRHRDAALEARGWKVLRISNVELLSDLDGVAEAIVATAIARPVRSRRSA